MRRAPWHVSWPTCAWWTSRAKASWSRAKRAASKREGTCLLYVDADCRPPLTWLERIERHFDRDPDLVALSGPYRFYDWDWWGRALILAYDFTLAPATQVLVKHILRLGSIFYGGNFAARRSALESIGGFDTSIEFHGEDTNVGRRSCARRAVATDRAPPPSPGQFRGIGSPAAGRRARQSIPSQPASVAAI